ncbi:glycosyltransferase family A protein [Chloroflexus sp.]|uniref:glycosyltransferase family A protein n=1 Tax=Chloroflexus sp. TaxID=1904827 RepID=UPI0026188D43|nr:glycosyltransferase family A protein [uncultured Chloroflexus sp.]
MSGQPRITFGMIVLNGEPFLRYNLRAIYPFAHQIIVAEGASPRAAHAATADGHSIDGTLEALYRFKAEEDPDDKLIIVTAEMCGHANGFWPGEKDEQSRAYAGRATGDWLWQIDVDEFYHPADMARVVTFLQQHPDTTCLCFRAYHFWGGFDYLVDGGLFWHRQYQGEPWGRYRRVLRWQPGFRYDTHRPPTIVDQQGRDITRRRMRYADAFGVWMYHYYMVFPHQFTRKGAYYQNQPWERERGRLQKNLDLLSEVHPGNGLRIMDQYGTQNWLTRFTGHHPPAIEALRADIAAGKVQVELRRTDDIERLLADPRYARMVQVACRRERLRAWRNHLIYLIWWRPRSRLIQFLREQVPPALVQRLPATMQRKFIPEHRRRYQEQLTRYQRSIGSGDAT